MNIKSFIIFFFSFTFVLTNSSCQGSKELKASKWFNHSHKNRPIVLNDDYVPGAWRPILITQNKISVSNRAYDLGSTDIITQITSANFEILNSNIKIVVNESTLSFSLPQVIQKSKGLIKIRRFATLGNMTFNVDYSFEYDGMIWLQLNILSEEPSTKIEKLQVIVPIKKNIAEFVHFVGAPKKLESQSLIKNSFSHRLVKSKGVVFNSAFKTSLWIGNNDVGLQWFAESDETWWPKDRKNYISIINNENDVSLVLNIINSTHPGSINHKKISFGFLATPVKKMPTHWRSWTVSAQYDGFKGDKRGDLVVYWPDQWRSMILDPDPTRIKNKPKTQARIKKDIQEGRKIIPYWSKLHNVIKEKTKVNPDIVKMGEKWMVTPNRNDKDRNLQLKRMSCNSEWPDYLVWCVETWREKMGHLDGIYMDEVQPIPNYSNSSGGGYDDFENTRQPTYDVFGARKMYKHFLFNTTKANNSETFFIAHASGTNTLHSLSHFDMLLTGEQFNSGYFKRTPEFLPPEEDKLYYYSYALPMDRLRVEGYWKQWGVPIIFLPNLKNQKDIVENPISTRDMLSRVIQVDMLIWPLWCNKEEVFKFWAIRKKFDIGNADVEFIPYWENSVFQSQDKNVMIGYYKKDNKYLILISNLSKKPKKILIHSSMGLRSLKNAENGNVLSVKNNSFFINIKRNDYAILEVYLK